MKRSLFVTGLGILAAGCVPSGPAQHYDVLGAAAEPLRTRFNAAKGKVRVLMLVSPT